MPDPALPSLFLERLKPLLPSDCNIDTLFGPAAHKTFRVNTLKAGVDEVFAWLKQENIAYAPLPWYPSAFSVAAADAPRVLESPLAAGGKVYAQGAESLVPVAVLDPQPGQTVLDMCAAPGSKTTQIAAHMRNEGTLIANEPVRDRFFRLKSVVELLGAKVRLSQKDGRFMRGEAIFDRILVDAPCSAEGRFSRGNPKSYAFWSLRKVHEMAHKQKGLLLNASRLLKPGGVLVYATCTFSREENEEVVEWFLRKSSGFTAAAPVWPAVAHQPTLPGCLRVLPQGLTEGFFVARFIKA